MPRLVVRLVRRTVPIHRVDFCVDSDFCGRSPAEQCESADGELQVAGADLRFLVRVGI